MNEVSYTTNYHFNLFSIGKPLRQGWNLGENYETIRTEKSGYKVNFYGKVMTTNRVIYYMYLKRNTEVSGASTESNNRITLKQSHDMLGHRKIIMEP